MDREKIKRLQKFNKKLRIGCLIIFFAPIILYLLLIGTVYTSGFLYRMFADVKTEVHFIDCVRLLKPNMTLNRVEGLFYSQIKSEEELCTHGSYWMDSTFSSKKAYKSLTYRKSPENESGFDRVIIYFDSDDKIIGFDYLAD